MGYELKHIIAICLIVKLVALSTEFSIRPKTETLNQGSDTVKSPQLTSLAGAEEPWPTLMDVKSQGVHFNLGPGGTEFNDVRKFDKKYVTKSEEVRINPAFDTCEHMAESLETSKWRDIQKTLHWLNRALASSSNNTRNCRRKFTRKTKPKFRMLNEKSTFYSPKINSKSKNYFQMKKFSDTLIMKCRKKLIKSLTPPGDWERVEKLKNECEHKYKFGRNKLKRFYEKKSRGKTKNRKYSRKRIAEKRRRNSVRRPATSNDTAASDSFPGYYEKSPRNEKENFTGEKGRSEGKSDLGKIHRDAEENPGTSRGSGNVSRKWPVSFDSADGKNYKKGNPWPNFVYHRVSSDLFRLASTGSNRKQSAYVAISVNTSGVPETVRNKKKNFGL